MEGELNQAVSSDTKALLSTTLPLVNDEIMAAVEFNSLLLQSDNS